MLVCFEGPDCAGKTSISDRVTSHYFSHCDNYDMIAANVKYLHFPRLEASKNLKKMLKEDGIHNKYYAMMEFMTNFYEVMNSSAGPNNGKTYAEIARGKDSLLVLDRYFYSTYILSQHIWNDPDEAVPSFSSEEESTAYFKQKQDDYKRLLGLSQIIVEELKLPVPDLNFVIIPSIREYKNRLKEKQDKDSIEKNQEHMNNAAYYDYLKAAVDYSKTIFGSNGEKRPPIIVRDTPISTNIDVQLSIAAPSYLANEIIIIINKLLFNFDGFTPVKIDGETTEVEKYEFKEIKDVSNH